MPEKGEATGIAAKPVQRKIESRKKARVELSHQALPGPSFGLVGGAAESGKGGKRWVPQQPEGADIEFRWCLHVFLGALR